MRKSCRHNQASKDYLEMKDTTIKDLVNDASVSSLVNNIRGAIPLAGGADAETQPFEEEIITPEPRNVGDITPETRGEVRNIEGDLGTPEVVKPPSELTHQPTIVGEPRGEVLITGEPKMDERSVTPKFREDLEYIEEFEYIEPDYYTSFSEYTEMPEPNAEKWTKFLDLMTLRMDESDLLQILNLFEGYCPDEDDLEIFGEEKCMEILDDEVQELNESFLCYLSCMSDDFDMILPERMFYEIQNEGVGDLSKEELMGKQKKKTKKKRKKTRGKRKSTKKSHRKKKRKTTRKKKKQGDLIDKIIDRLGY
jgi:hypothetical protein